MYREQNPDEEPPAVRWLPFQLNPDLPPEGISRQAYIERKFGPGGNKYERVSGVGKEVGILRIRQYQGAAEHGERAPADVVWCKPRARR